MATTPKPTDIRPARLRGADVQAQTVAHLEGRIAYLRQVVDASVGKGDHTAATKWFVELRRAEDELLGRRRADALASITDPLAHAIACRDAALAEGAATAASQWGGRIADMEAELARQALQQGDQRRPEDLSDDEWRARVESDARAAPLVDLDVYATEWLSRAGYRIERDESGTLSLVRSER